MAHIAVLGLGNWGSAIARIWLLEGHNVKGWTIEQEVYESITMENMNNKYLPSYSLEGLDVTMHVKEALEESEIVVLALPSSVILNVVEEILPYLRPGHVLLDLAKGLAPGKRLISQAIHEMLSSKNMHNPLAVLTGPTIAPEAAAGVMTTALVASEDMSVAERLAATLSTPTFVLHAASDPEGAELWGAFKNVVALSCGLVDGLKNIGTLGGDNLKAAIFNSGFREGCLLLPKLGARAEVAFGPAGLGDLYVTATSPHGRNRRMGEKLGSGLTLEEALEEMVMVAEGVRAARMFRDRAEDMNIEVPFVKAINTLLDGHIDAEECCRRMVALS
ncbi:MAG: NAD(P)H-dependent glycerol-3-phosphate dehydrogenase [Candidatus Poseidoniaceae archaeon]|jgi:glycerol-3-phosphate dehydrogenase (NAD(P)+)|nr:NAD(P)H-dependent glycerol-3-phosphate dehydrogenase [Candidatus Poseidoniaceae archaeon]